ncbi:DUF2231 domain-containing protein [Mariniblastus fucicola]|nr:DUF2231 domain-containing protein [Mariniblastus fucicola]
MSHRFRSSVLFTIFCFVLPGTAFGQIDFESDIKPIFENHCIACHGGDDPADFSIADKDGTLSYVIEEDAESSDLYTVLIAEDESHRMPPPNTAKPLSEVQIELVKAWINEGAIWPDELESEWEQVPLPPAEDSQLPYRAAGSLHPALVHLPIGLLLASGLFAFLSLRGNFVMSDCAYYCLWLGAIGSVFACASGWFFSEMEGYGTVKEVADVLDQDNAMFWHRITGLGASVFAVILALFAASSRNKDPDDGIMWKLAAILLACGIGYVGHEGGELHYGEDHYKDANALIESFFPSNAKEDGDRTIDEDADSGDDAPVSEDGTEIQPLST